MYALENQIKAYSWGSYDAIAKLLGRPAPSREPEAELWMGAHPGAPSRVTAGGRAVSLTELIESAPETILGRPVLSAFGARLPFLLKVLAARTPLSLQAHPNPEQAKQGFAREEQAGVLRDAPFRNYKDDSHKPELICALGRFEALCGFRRAEETLHFLRGLEIAPLMEGLAALDQETDARGICALFSWLLSRGDDARRRIVDATLEACRKHCEHGGARLSECQWALRLGNAYPDDIGVVIALLLNLVRLEEGEAIYLPAGNLHAYLEGVGIEIMASSDNVVRGGLTEKHVDAEELVGILSFEHGPVPVVRARALGAEHVFDTPAAEFRLSRIELERGLSFRADDRRGPEILLCVAGAARAKAHAGGELAFGRGESIFIDASEGSYELEGDGRIFRATLGAALSDRMGGVV